MSPLPADSGQRPADLAPGTMIGDRYEVGGRLGEGGMGTVYAGRYEAIGRDVAIKVLGNRWSRNPQIVARFKAEARASNKVRHPNVVEVFDTGTLEDGRLYLVMEHIDGADLRDMIFRTGRFPIEQASWIGLEIARGMRAAHDVGIIHRDLKPDNVMVHQHHDGQVVKIMDFGIASGAMIPSEGKTAPGSTIGTPDYMAPEQVDGHTATPAFDIYAFGVVLFELLTGRLPIDDENPMRLMTRKTVETSPPVASIRPDVPKELAALVDGCLARDPSERIASMAEAVAVLQEVTGAAVSVVALRLDLPSVVPTQVESTTSLPELPRPARSSGSKSRSSAWIAVGVAVAVACAATVWAWVSSQERLEEFAGRGLATVDATIEARPPRRLRVPSIRSLRGAHRSQEQLPDLTRPSSKPVRPSTHGTGDKTHATKDPGSSQCKEARRSAEDARQSQSWARLLRNAKRRGCWESEAERKKLLTLAYMNLEQFGDCIRAGKGIETGEVKKMVRICEARN